MTEIQIPYLPTAQFFKIRCRLGINEQDIIGDSDSDPQIRTIGGTVTISASIPRFRYTEADGRRRVVYTKTETYNIQTSTGELFDADGNIGVNLLNTNSPQMDPQGWTYKATVRPNGGEPFDVPIPSDGGGEVFDLGDGLVFTPSTGITDLETRVKALEDGPSGGGLDTEGVQDIVGAMVSAAGGAYDDAAGTIVLPSGGAGTVSSVAGRTGDIVLSSADLTDAASLATDAELAAGLAGKAPALGADDNYVTDAEKVKLANLSGTNTGDQDLSGYATTASLATVATTGAYADLSGKPTIPDSPDDIGAAPATQPINAQTGTTYTLAASDAGKLVTLTNAAAITLTVPASVFTAGQRVDIGQRGAGVATVVAGAGMTVNPPPGGSLVMQGQYAYASLVFISATVADLVGLVAAP